MGQGLHRHAFWFYSVVVALGIEQAVTPVVRHLVISPQGLWSNGLEAFRLFVFLLVSVRFLLGAASHFEEVDREQNPGSYRLDFLSGFLHFLFLFAWSFTVEVRPNESAAISPYLLLLFVVLGYDLVWMAMCRGHTTDQAKGWTFVNTLTLLISLLAFFIAKAGGWGTYAEHVPALIVVSLVSFADLGEITSGKRYITAKLASWMGIKIPPSD